MTRLLLLLIVCLAFVDAMAQAPDSLNMHVLYHWQEESLPDASLGGSPFSYSGGTGMALNGKEFAVMGSSSYIHFFDVTNPATATEIGRFYGGPETVWREFKTFKNYVYAVSDNTVEGLFVFDMSQAPDTVLLVKHDAVSFQRSHTLEIDTINERLYLTGSNAMSPGVLVMSLANPADPTVIVAKQLDGGYIHDSYVRDNILYANSGYNGLWVYDLTDPNTPVVLASTITNGYCHSSSMNLSGTKLVNCDEVGAGLPILLYDITNVNTGELTLVKSFRESLIELPDSIMQVTYHNPYYMGEDIIGVASYRDGFVMFDVSDPLNPARIAWYDTHPDNVDYSAYPYQGNWGAFVYLPSGHILVFDINRGLYVLANELLPTSTSNAVIAQQRVWPNPTTAGGTLQFETSDAVSYALYDLLGREMAKGPLAAGATSLVLPSALSAGHYTLHFLSQKGTQIARIEVK